MTDEPNAPGSPPPLGAIRPGDPLPAGKGAVAPGSPPERMPVHEITLPRMEPALREPAKPVPSVKTHQQHDSFREFIETVVFVVVLVLILKTFLAEAFVIPTGSMATTLLGYHKDVTCEQCRYHFLVNASKEADPAEHQPQAVTACTCPNCFFVNNFRARFP